MMQHAILDYSDVIWTTLRLDYLPPLLKQLTDPLRVLSKDEAVEKVVEFMNSYSISQDDFDTIVEIAKFQEHPNPLHGIKKAPKKRVAAMLEPGEDTLAEEIGVAVGENEEHSSETDDLVDPEKRLQADLQSLNSKGIQVQMDLKGPESSSAKRASSGRGRGSSEASAEKKGGRCSGAASKRRGENSSGKGIPGCECPRSL